MVPQISVIIITLNEEKRLPALLSSLHAQSYNNFEIIVSDANSTDKTRSIARAHGCRVVKGGKIAHGRNEGASAARGEILVFLDADVLLPANFLQHVCATFQSPKRVLATAWSWPESKDVFSWLFFIVWNSYVLITMPFAPRAPGYCMVARASAHRSIRGFDSKVQFEDIDYSARTRKHGSFGMLPLAICVSDRRFHKGNRWRTVRVLLRSEWDRLRGVNRWYKEYTFGEHPEQQNRTIFKPRSPRK